MVFLHKSGEAIELFGPEALVAVEPVMASSMGAALSGRPRCGRFVARDQAGVESTSRCFMIAGSDTGNGCASSLTTRLSPRRAGDDARAGSGRTAPQRSGPGGVLKLNHWLSVG